MNSTIGILLDDMRAKAPLVQCITNYVAMNIAANVMLAAGASPAMVHAREEAAEFVAIAGALTINIGTLSKEWIAAMLCACEAANASGKPWVFDPVAHFATAFRQEATASLMALKPTIVRANASEIIALSGGSGGGRGVDAGDPVERAEAGAIAVAQRHGCIVAVTGSTDFVTDGARHLRISGGSPLMPCVTALGCSLTCLVGAFAATRPEYPFEATTAALAMFAVAGRRAGLGAEGPGMFAWRFLDELAALNGATVEAEARVVAA